MPDEKRLISTINLDKDFEASTKRLNELKAGRDLGDIPLTDDYFKAVKKHQKAHGGKK